jgi:transposase-like protein
MDLTRFDANLIYPCGRHCRNRTTRGDHTVAQIADILGISRAIVYRYLERGGPRGEFAR